MSALDVLDAAMTPPLGAVGACDFESSLSTRAPQRAADASHFFVQQRGRGQNNRLETKTGPASVIRAARVTVDGQGGAFDTSLSPRSSLTPIARPTTWGLSGPRHQPRDRDQIPKRGPYSDVAPLPKQLSAPEVTPTPPKHSSLSSPYR